MHRHSSVNRLYRLVWNDALMIWTAVAEIARGRGKSGTGRRRMAALLALNAGFVLGPPATAGPNNIQPDGRTQTTVNASGGATSVHTSTTSGSNAFNSFSTFTVGGGQVVNMHLPAGSANLINLVTDSRATINGMLNSIKGNKIGGNVFFASPHGFLVGSGGVVNVGSLTVSTPTRSFLDTFFTVTGDIDDLSVGALLDGSAPDEGGAIAIDGTVNAMGGVKFRGGSIRISGTVYRGAKFVGLAPDFSDVVNANGLAAGTKIVEVDGRIQVVAEDDPAAAVAPVASVTEEDSENATGSVDIQASQDVSVSGAIRNEGSEGVSGGLIDIRAGNNIALEFGANISAAGSGANSAGGTVYMMAANNSVIRTGATVDASAGTSGNAGAIEFSAKKNVDLAGGLFKATATAGTVGTVLIDPTDVTVSANFYSGGANHTILADNTITVDTGVVVSTRTVALGSGGDQLGDASTGNSGSLSLQAGSITLNTGSALISSADSGFDGGNITINATRAPGGALGGGGTAGITATGATIMGAGVSLQAQSDYDDTGALVPLPLAIPSATASISLTDTAVSASGTLAIGAKASVDTSPLGDTPLAISVVNSSATVNVAGTSVLSSTGNATLSAESAVTSNVKPSGLGLALPADAAVAISTINSTATVVVGGSSSVTSGAALELSAKNTVEATTVADITASQPAAVGGTVAVTVLNTVTKASIEDSATTQAASLKVSADSRNTVVNTAKAASKGATQQAAGASKTEETLGDYKEEGKTSEGSVEVAAAVAVVSLNSQTSAVVSSTGLQKATTGLVTVSSLASNASTVEADGSSVGGSANVGVGAAVAINIGVLDNTAVIADNAQVEGVGVTVLADNHTGEKNSFSTKSTSGAGASNVGVAGSLAVGTVVSNTAATLEKNTDGVGSGAHVDAGGGDVLVQAGNATSSAVEAGAKVTGAGDAAKVGVGASVGLNVGVNTTLAEVGDAAVLAGAASLAINATADHAMTTQVTGGAAGARISVTPVAAVSVGINSTTARLGEGNLLSLSGGYSSQAEQSTKQTTVATGATEGSQVSVGASVAVGVAEDTVVAAIDRDLTAGLDIGVSAVGASLSDTSATASVKGGKKADENDTPKNEDGTDSQTVDQQVKGQGDAAKDSGKAAADKNGPSAAGSKLNDSKSKESPKAETSEGGVSVAAAVGVNAANHNVSATVARDVTINSAGGALIVGSTAETDAKAKADGSQVDAGGTNVGVGAAVAVNAVTSSNQAIVGDDAQVTTRGLSVKAEMAAADVGKGTDGTNSYGADAKSGAGAANVGVAGAVAINTVASSTVAALETDIDTSGAGANVTAGTGAVDMAASSKSASTVKSGADVQGTDASAKVGVGASVAVNVEVNTTTAEVARAAVLSGGANMTLNAKAERSMVTEATGGAAGAKVAVTPVVAVSVGINTTTAELAEGAALNLSGSYSSEARQSTDQKTVATGQTEGSQVAVGASIAVGVVEDSVVASVDRNLTAGTGVGVAAIGTSKSDTSATASVKGGKEADEDGNAPAEGGAPGKTVDQQVKTQSDSAKDSGQATAGTGSAASDKLEASKAKEAPKAEADSNGDGTGEGVSVAAAVGVNVATAETTASIGAGRQITSAAGALSVTSTAETDAKAKADGSQIDAGGTDVGIGAAVAVNAATAKNTAIVRDNAVVDTQGLTVKAAMDGAAKNDFSADAKSGAGAGNVGVAGSLAINIVDNTSVARLEGDTDGIGIGASVDANAGNILIEAANASTSTVKAAADVKGTGDSASVGVGASVGVNVAVNSTIAEVANMAVVTGGASMGVNARADHTLSTELVGGSAGAKTSITPVVAVSIGVNTTQARVGASATGLNLSGAFSSSAEQTHVMTTKATAQAQGDTAVGASLAAAIAVDDVSAELQRDIDNSTGVELIALSQTSITTETTAGAKGAKKAKTNESTGAEEPEENTTVDDQKKNQLDFAKSKNAGAAGVNTDTQEAKTPDTSSKTPGTEKPTQTSEQGRKDQNGQKISVAAAIGVSVARNQGRAEIGQGLNIHAGTGELKLDAQSDTNYSTKSSGEAVSEDDAVGVAVAVTATHNVTQATLGAGTTVTHAGDVNINAESRQNRDPAFQTKMSAEAVSGASGGGTSVAGGLALVVNENQTLASIDEGVTLGSVSDVGHVSVTAEDTSKISALARSGALTKGGESKTGVGASFAVLVSLNENHAVVGRDADDNGSFVATEVNAESLSVKAAKNRVSDPAAKNFTVDEAKNLDFLTFHPSDFLASNNYYTEAIAGAASQGGTAVAGAFAVNVFTNKSVAELGEAVSVTTTGSTGPDTLGVEVSSLSDMQSVTIAGAAAGAKQTGVGISNADTVNLDETRAAIGEGTSVVADGANAGVRLQAESLQEMTNVGVSAGASTSGTAVAGVLGVVVALGQTEASIGDGASVKAQGDVSVKAHNDVNGVMIAGGVAGASQTGVGASIAAHVLANATTATIGDADVSSAKQLTVAAQAAEEITSIVLAGTGAGTTGIAGALAVNVIVSDTQALVNQGAQVNTFAGYSSLDQGVAITASDDTKILAITGGGAGGGTTGVGAALETDVMAKTVTAGIADGTGTQVNAKKDVVIDASSSEDLVSVAVGFGVAGSTAVSAGIAIGVVDNDVHAMIGADAVVDADGNVGVNAQDDVKAVLTPASIALSGSTAVGGSIGVATLLGSTKATVGDRAVVNARGLGDARTVYTGETTEGSTSIKPTALGAKQTEQARGLSVTAYNREELITTVASASGSGSASVAATVSADVIANTTEASIGRSARINESNGSAGAEQQVRVKAIDETSLINSVGSASVGGSAGIGAGANVAVITKTTTAKIGKGSVVNANGAVEVEAASLDSTLSTTIGLAGGGSVAVGGAVAGVGIANTTEAFIEDGTSAADAARIDVAAGDLTVKADGFANSWMVSGAVGAAGAAGVGASLSVVVNASSTKAKIGDFAETDASGITSVHADSTESVNTITVAGAGGGSAGIAGSIAVNVVTSNTEAVIGDNAMVNQKLGGPGEGVDVRATDRIESLSVTGAVGAGGAAGVGAAVSVTVAQNTTLAAIGDNARVSATQDIAVEASSDKVVDSVAAAGAGGGAAGVAGAISIVTVGMLLDGESQDGVGSTLASSDAETGSSKVGNNLGGSVQAGKTKTELDNSTDAMAIGGSLQAGAVPQQNTIASIGAGAHVRAGNDVSVGASDKTDVLQVGGGAAGGGAAGVAGSLGVTLLRDSAAATVGDGAHVDAGGTLDVHAETAESVLNIGISAAGGGAVGVSGSVAINVISSESVAAIGAAQINQSVAGSGNRSVLVQAKSDTELITVAGSGGGGGAAAVGGVLNVNTLSKNTSAHIGEGANVDADLDVRVAADSQQQIIGAGISVQGSGAASVGGAAAVNVIDNNTQAFIGSAQVDATKTAAHIDSDGNVAISAADDTLLMGVSASATGSGIAAVGGAVGVNVITSETLAYLGDNSSVNARGNAVNGATVYDGNINQSVARALPTAPTGKGDLDVDGDGVKDGDVNDGASFNLSAESDDGNASSTSNPETTKDSEGTAISGIAGGLGTRGTEQVKGFSVTAVGSEKIVTASLGVAAAGAAGVTGTVTANVISSVTQARIGDGAQVNKTDAAGAPVGADAVGADPSVRVLATDDTLVVMASGTMSGGIAGVSGSVNTVVVDKQTSATIGDADVKARNVDVRAEASENLFLATANVSVGAAGIGAAVSVASVANTTTAGIDAGAHVDATGNLGVKADQDTAIDMYTLAGSAGGAAVSGAVSVGVVDNTTQAYVEGAASPAEAATLNAGGTTEVAATSSAEMSSVTGSAAAGGVGVAGSVGVKVLTSSTTASIGDNTRVNQTRSGAAQDVKVSATDTVNLKGGGVAGAVGGGIGVGAMSDTNIVRNTTTASIGNSTLVDADRDVSVAAASSKNVESTAVAIAAGGLFGGAGSASVAVIGTSLNDEAQEGLGDGATAGRADQQAKQTNASTQLAKVSDSDHLSGAKSTTDAKAAGLGVQGDMNSTSTASQDKTQAFIGNNSRVTTGGKVDVTASDKTQLDLEVVGAAGGAVGIGAAVGVGITNSTTEAFVGSSTAVDAAGDVTVQATAGNLDATGSRVHSAAGAGGVIGVSAAVSVLKDSSTTRAYLGNSASIERGSLVTVSASTDRKSEAETVGVAAGGLAVGASIAVADFDGETSATVGSGVQAGKIAGKQVDNLTVSANDVSRATASAIAGAAGILSGAGADATARVGSTVSATVGVNADMVVQQNLTVNAQATPQSSAESYGVSAGLAAVGVSLAEASFDGSVSASVGSGSNITADNLAVRAKTLGSTVDSFAAGASGGLIGINGSDSQAEYAGSTTATIGDNSTITGSAEVSAATTTFQTAEATGVSVGFIAGGAVLSEASSHSTTTATLGNNVSASGGNLVVSATGNDTNDASAVAGSGGVVSGVASRATTNNTSVTTASVGSGDASHTLDVGAMQVTASHQATFNGEVDSVNASLVGASGASAVHGVNATVAATVADNARIDAEDFSMRADNKVRKDWLGAATGDAAGWNVRSGSGGLIDAPAGSSVTHISQTTNASLGDDAQVNITATSGTETFTMDAYNEVIAHDKVKLDSGGAVAVAKAVSKVLVDKSDATVSFGERAQVVSDLGNISAGSRSLVDIETRAAADTYGLAGAPSGEAYSVFNGNNTAEVKANALLHATDGEIFLAGGQDTNRSASNINVHSKVNLWNKTAIPIDTSPDARSTVLNNATIRMDAGSVVEAAGDISLYADRGSVNATATGIGKDIYRETAGEIASGISNLFGGDDVSFDVTGGTTTTGGTAVAHIDGIARTGINRFASLTLDYVLDTSCGAAVCRDPAGNVLWTMVPTATDGVTFNRTFAVGLAANILARIDRLRALLVEYAGDPVAAGAYQSEINFLQFKLIELGLAGTDPSGNFAAGTFNSPSPREQAQTQLLGNQSIVFEHVSDANAAAGTLGTAASSADGSLTTLQTSANAVVTNSGSSGTKNAQINTLLQGLNGFDAGNATYQALNADIAQNATLAGEVNTLRGANATDQTAVDTRRQTVATRVSEINTRVSTISGLVAQVAGGNVAAASQIVTLQAEIDSRQAEINTLSGEIETLLTDISGRNTSIDTRVDSIVTNNGEIATRQATLRDAWANAGDAGEVTTLTTRLTENAVFTSAIAGAASTIETQRGNVSAALSTVSAQQAIVNAEVTAAARTTATTEVATLATQLPTLSTLAADGPTADFVEVDDITVRLGSIRTKGDRLEGIGELRAPGDAQINITNNTPNFLVINDLTIDSNDGGTLSHNGILVNNNEDINRVNGGGSSAAFHAVVTRDSTGAPVPSINITSNYDPNSPIYANLPAPAPDIDLRGDITNLRGSVNVLSKAGSILTSGSINAGTVNIKAENGDFVQSFVDGFSHVGGDPASGHDFGTPLGTGIVANGSVVISARFLNINSTVQSGIEQWDVTLPAAPKLTGPASLFGLSQSALDAAVTTFKNDGTPRFVTFTTAAGTVTFDAQLGRLEADLAYANADRLTAGWASRTASFNGLYPLVSDYGNIGVFYDPANVRYEINGTQVRGGYIQLYGQIMNTGDPGGTNSGKLKVLDGYGQIRITNPTGLAIVINNLDTGSDPTGTLRGTAGKIDITDIQGTYVNTANLNDPLNGTVNAIHSVYTRDHVVGTDTSSVQLLRETGRIEKDGSFTITSSTNGADGSATDGRHTAYSPQNGLRYVWTTGTDDSSYTYWQFSGTQFLGIESLRTQPSGTVESRSGPFTRASYRLMDGTYLKIDAPNTGTRFLSSTNTVTSASPDWLKTAEWTNCNWWTICIAQDYHSKWTETSYTTSITTKSLKADYPIGIEFIGYDQGNVAINSASDVLLKGSIRNASGTTTITAGIAGAAPNGVTPLGGVSMAGKSISQVKDEALIRSKDLKLAASGSVGGQVGIDPPKFIATAITGTLDASATSGNVRVHQTLGDLKVGSVTAGGSSPAGTSRVYLRADGSIVAANPATTLIQGDRVELTSENGGIGSMATPLAVNVGHSDDLAQRVFYGFKGQAQDDISIRAATWAGNTNGNLLLDTVVSTGGDVRIEAPGRILDNNPIEQIDSRTWNELLNYWDSLGLRAGTAENAEKQAQAIKAFEFGKTADYRLYWQIRNHQASPAAYDPSFVYVASAAERDALTAAGSNVASFESDRTTRYHQLNAEVGTLTGNAFNGAFAYAASTAERDAILNKSSWTEQQLGISVTPGLLKNLTSTDPVIKSANVSGGTVTLVAGGAVGETNSAVVIPTNIQAEFMTAEQKVALAAAERSDVVITDTEITVSQRKPVRFDATDAINVSVAGTLPAHADNGRIYLASQGDARLGLISAPAETRIKVRGSIVNAAVSAVNTGDLTLEAANGGIGHIPSDGVNPEVSQPLHIGLLPGASLIARAAGNVDVVQTGDLLVDTVFSRNDAQLTATGSILDDQDDDELNVLADNVNLIAQGGSVGTSTNALDVGVELATDEATGETDAGRITASSAIGSGVFLNGPLGGRFNIGDIQSGGAVGLTSDLSMLIDGAVTGSGDFNLVSGGSTTVTAEGDVHSTAGAISLRAASLNMQDAQRQQDDGEDLAPGVVVGDAARLRSDAGALDIETTGDARVTGIETGNGTANAARIVSTAGRVLDSGDTRLDIIADAAPSATLNVAGLLGVGSDGNPLDIRVRNLTAASSEGSVALDVSGDVNVQTVQAGDAVQLTATGNITGDSVSSTGLGNQGADKSVSVTSTGGSVTLDSVSGTQNVAVDGQTGVNLTTVSSTGGSVALNSGAGDISADRTEAAGNVTMTAPAGAITAGFTRAGGDVVLMARGQIDTDTIIAGRDLVVDSATAGVTARSMQSGRSLTIDTARAIDISNLLVGGDLSLTSSRGRVDLGTARVGGDAEIAGQTGVSVDRITADNIALASRGGSVEAGTLQARGGEIELAARRNIDVDNATSRTFTALSSAGNVEAGTVRASEVTMAAPGTVTGRSLNVGSSVRLAGDRVEANIQSTGDGDVGGAINGFTGGLASDVQLRLNTPFAFRFDNLFSSTGNVDIPTGDLYIGSLWVSNRMTLSNPQTRVLVDQNDRRIQPFDVQLYSAGSPFPFSLVRNRVGADALVIYRSPNHEVLTPNGNNLSAAELADRELALVGFVPSLFLPAGHEGGGAGNLVNFEGVPVQMDEECRPGEGTDGSANTSSKCKEDQK